MTHDVRFEEGKTISARMLNRVAERTFETEIGSSIDAFRQSQTIIQGRNLSGIDIGMGECLRISGWEGTSENPLAMAANMIAKCKLIEWHSLISKAVIAAEPIPDGEIGDFVVSGLCVVRVLGDADNYYSYYSSGNDGEFIMPDPGKIDIGGAGPGDGQDSPYCIITTGGIGKVLWQITEEYAAVNLRHEQLRFRYKLKSLFSSSTDRAFAYLYDLNGDPVRGTGIDENGADIFVTDRLGLMDDQSIDDEGFCFLAGNEFHADQANCSD